VKTKGSLYLNNIVGQHFLVDEILSTKHVGFVVITRSKFHEV